MMKNYSKKIWPICLLIGLQACGNADRNGRDSTATGTIDSLNDTTAAAQVLTTDVDVNGDGKMFVLNAAAGGMMEVQVANMVLQKSKNKEVKEFAGQRLKDHEMANEELRRIANEKGFQLPQTLPKTMASDLVQMNTLAERAFNVQYIKMAINNHQKTVQILTDGSGLKDPELKNFAIKTLPVVQKHYQTALAIGKRLNITNANNGDDILGLSPAESKK